MRSFRDVVLEGRDDARPWLIVPEDPCSHAGHRAIARAQLCRDVLSIATSLRRAGAVSGDRVVVIADNSAEASTLLVAVLAAGMVAVPVSPRSMGLSRERWYALLRRVTESCRPSSIVGRALCLPPADVVAAPCIGFESLNEEGDERDLHGAAPDALALIQYTSGTTGQARGVELTHANVIHDIVAIDDRIGFTAADVGLTWLPLFHDMGLIGSLLAATYVRIPLVLMSPSSFLLRPESWLWAISRFGATCSAAPNSAYQLCCSKIPERKLEGLALSSWRVALNGAELVHAATVGAFGERFGRFGFRPNAMYPVYGLAENTIATAFPEYGQPPAIDWVDRSALDVEGVARPVAPSDSRSARAIVSVGRALRSQELRVVDPSAGRPVPERVVGLIQVRGACVMRGYHRDSEQTALVLDADGWLDTGDLGYLARGELHVVGRSKEVINRAGRKYGAAELQAALQDVYGIRGGNVAAFGVPDTTTGTEAVVVMAETVLRDRRERDALRAAISAVLSHVFALAPDVIALVPAGTVPRTTSGKVQHGRARALFLEGRHAPYEAERDAELSTASAP